MEDFTKGPTVFAIPSFSGGCGGGRGGEGRGGRGSGRRGGSGGGRREDDGPTVFATPSLSGSGGGGRRGGWGAGCRASCGEGWHKKRHVCKPTLESRGFCFTSPINEHLEALLPVFKNYSVSTFILEHVYLNDDGVAVMRKHLVGCGLKKLVISYNKNISAAGYKQIGELILESNLTSINVTDCNITDEKLESMIAGLKDGKLNELDLSCNANLTNQGFAALAELVARECVKKLKLSGCKLSREKIEVFYKLLPQPGKNTLLEELDLSYNATMNPDTVIGALVVKCGITQLSLAGCRLSDGHLIHFRKLTKGFKVQMDILNVSGNFSLSEGIVEVAKLVKELKLKELDMCDCMLSARDLEYFRNALDGTKLDCLHLGDQGRKHQEEYLVEVCRMRMHVASDFTFRTRTLNDAPRSFLQNKLLCKVLVDGEERQETET